MIAYMQLLAESPQLNWQYQNDKYYMLDIARLTVNL